MTVGKAIYYLLNNSTDLEAVVGTRIFPEVAEQDSALPFVMYSVISNEPSDTHSGPSLLDVAQVDVIAYNTSYSGCIDMGVYIRAALDRVTGTYNGVNVQSCQYNSEVIDFDEYKRAYVITQSYDVRISRTEFEIAQGTPVTGARLGDLYDVTDDATTGQVIIKQADGTWAAGDQGTGTGGVDSVNGETGNVTLTTDDISDTGQTNKYTTAADITKLSGIEAGAQVNDVTSVNGQTGAITGLATSAYVDAEVSSEESARITADTSLQTQITSNDGDITALQGRMTTAESDIDALEAADYVNTVNGVDGAVTIAAGSNVTVSTAGQTITISSSGGGGGGNKFTDIDGVTADSGSSAVDLIASTGMSITPNNTTKTITFAVSGLDTDDITEAGNLYYTDARADARIAAANVTDLSDVTSAGSGAIITTAERSKLAGIEAGAQVNVATDLTHTTSTLTVRVESSTGSDTTILAASASAAGVMTASDRTKLDGIEAGAEVNPTAAEVKTLYESNADTNAFTDAEQTKLAGIAAGAEVNVNADWNAVSGDALILNKPTIPEAAYPSITLTGNTTLSGAHAQKFLICDSAGGFTLLVPPGYIKDAEVLVYQANAGPVTISAGNGVTLRNTSNFQNITAEQYAVIGLKQLGTTNVWIITGERKPV